MNIGLASAPRRRQIPRVALREAQLSYQIIGLAMQVHRELGPGVDESFHHNLLVARLRAEGIEHLSKPRRTLVHRGLEADVLEADLVFPGRLIVELKRLWGGFSPEHFIQLKAYLRFWQITDGLLLDFGKELLCQKRFAFEDPGVSPREPEVLLASSPPRLHADPLAKILCTGTARVASQYGAGFRDTTYRGLLYAELTAEGVSCELNPNVSVHSTVGLLGESRLPCVALGRECAVMVLAQRRAIRPADRAILDSWLRHLGAPWGLIINFGDREVGLQWVRAGDSTRNRTELG